MNLSYSMQGAFFAMSFAGLLFLLRLTCPASSSECFSDYFAAPLFMPAVFMYRTTGELGMFTAYEPLVVIVYWGV
ncbi:MAG: hypothetical protein Q8O98_02320, partial [bacterium]|nr:hypothetical protein [bacterium]